MKNTTEITKQAVDMYEKEKMSTYEIAKFFNTYPNKIRRILLKNGVQINDKSTAQKNAIKKGIAKIPTQGKKRSKEEKLKISSSLKEYWDNISDEEYNIILEITDHAYSPYLSSLLISSKRSTLLICKSIFFIGK